MLMMAARFVDAFSDVTMGQIVDRSKTKDGEIPSMDQTYVRACGNCKFSDLSGRICRYVLWI